MGLFYDSLTAGERNPFQKRKRKFKAGRPCACCGRTRAAKRIMVAHLVPVRALPKEAALFDRQNWAVRCVQCEHALNHEEQLLVAAQIKAGTFREDDLVQQLREQRKSIVQARKEQNAQLALEGLWRLIICLE